MGNPPSESVFEKVKVPFMKKFFLKILVHAAMLICVMFYGILVGKFKFPPYALLKDGYALIKPKEHPERAFEYYTKVPKEYTNTDVAALISIKKASDIRRLRHDLIHFLWESPALPPWQPATIIHNYQDSRYEDIRSIYRIDKISIMMEFGLESITYHFIPKIPNNKIIMYHQGHRGDFIKGKEQIRQFLDRGYAVMGFSMPLLGLNNQPTITVPRIGKLKITTHDHMKFLFPKKGHPIQYFIEPVVVALNYLEKNYNYSLVSMIGISGGGWTTTLAAAADIRINCSFPVAGTYPIYLRSNEPNWGDFEQTNPDLYKRVNYLELYILGSFGKNRKQIQVINQYDPCCFSGLKWNTYKDIVRSRINQLGLGEFDLFLDDTHYRHAISGTTMTQVFHEMEQTYSGAQSSGHQHGKKNKPSRK